MPTPCLIYALVVKDTRTKHEDRDASGVLDGKIDGFIDAFLENASHRE